METQKSGVLKVRCAGVQAFGALKWGVLAFFVV